MVMGTEAGDGGGDTAFLLRLLLLLLFHLPLLSSVKSGSDATLERSLDGNVRRQIARSHQTGDERDSCWSSTGSRAEQRRGGTSQP